MRFICTFWSVATHHGEEQTIRCRTESEAERWRRYFVGQGWSATASPI